MNKLFFTHWLFDGLWTAYSLTQVQYRVMITILLLYIPPPLKHRVQVEDRSRLGEATWKGHSQYLGHHEDGCRPWGQRAAVQGWSPKSGAGNQRRRSSAVRNVKEP